MGVSTDAMLVYGIDLGEAEEEVFTNLGLSEDELDDLHPIYTERDDSRAVIMVEHCSHEYPMYIAGVPGTHREARRGYPQEVSSLDVPPDRLERFKAWCAEKGIKGEPKWLLCSYWG